MTKFTHTKGILDVVSMVNDRDTVVVLPGLDYALEWWRVYRTAITEAYGLPAVNHTKTAVVIKVRHTALRLWVPSTRDPQQPMDYPHRFAMQCDYVSPWYTPTELRRLAWRR